MTRFILEEDSLSNNDDNDMDDSDSDYTNQVAEKNGLSQEQMESIIHKKMIFVSEDQALEKYNELAREMGFSVRKGPFHYGVGGLKTSRLFVCYKEGFKENDGRSKNIRKNKEVRCGCLARLKLKQTKADEWEVVDIVYEHNHALTLPNLTHMLNSHRKMTETHKVEIDNLNDAGIQPKEGYEYMVHKAGGQESVGMTRQDYKNYLRNRRNEVLQHGGGSAIMDYFVKKTHENPSFFHSTKIDEGNRLTNFLWVDAIAKIDYHHFGDVVCFDTTYRTNEALRPFAPFVGVNHHRETVIFGAALLIDEMTESFEWLFKKWMEAMSGKAPLVILTDQCPSISKAIKNVFPTTTHRLCLWHIFQNAGKHLSQVYKHEEFKKTFNNCIYGCESEEEFMSDWKAMLDKYKLGSNRWLKKLYEEKHKWALVYGRDVFSAHMTTTQRSESINAYMKRYLDRKVPLVEFLDQYEKALRYRRYKERESDYKCIISKPSLYSAVPILEQASCIYTHAMFYVFEKEHKESLLWDVEYSGEDTRVHTYKVTKAKRKPRYVKVHPEIESYECSYRNFTFAGVLCSHIIRVFTQLGVKCIPDKYILNRWRKNPKSDIVTDPKGNHIEADYNVETSRRYSGLVHKAVKLATMSAPYEDLTVIAHEFLDDALVKMTAVHKAMDNIPKSCSMSNSTGVSNEKNITIAVGCERGQKRGAKTCFTKGKQKKISTVNPTSIQTRKRKSSSGKNEQVREDGAPMQIVPLEHDQCFDIAKDNASHTHHKMSFTELLQQVSKNNTSHMRHEMSFTELLQQDTFDLRNEDQLLPSMGDDPTNITQMPPPNYMLKNERDLPPKWSPHLDDLDPRIQHFIEKWDPVEGDGHCGFRSIAYLRNYEPCEGWKIVREELLTEMLTHELNYNEIYGETRFTFLQKNLECRTAPIWDRDYWFDLPDMGTLVANTYNCIFVCLAPRYISQTYLPWRKGPTQADIQIMTISHINQLSHYVPVRLHNRTPLPPIVPGWERIADDVAKPWGDIVEIQVLNWRRAIARPFIQALNAFIELCIDIYGYCDF